MNNKIFLKKSDYYIQNKGGKSWSLRFTNGKLTKKQLNFMSKYISSPQKLIT